MDMQTTSEFIARNASPDQVAKAIGADKVIYQSLDSLKKAVQMGNTNISHFCAACFDGIYPTGDITEDDLKKIEKDRTLIQHQLEMEI